MNVQSKPYRVASQTLRRASDPEHDSPASLARLCRAETQRQIAQKLGPVAADAVDRAPTKVDRHAESDRIAPTSQVTAEHRGKLAYIYVRQSSVNQVRHHQESTELQYRLVDRAVALGWPHERVHVIDEDLGKSGLG